jgi:NTE family protein
MFWRRKRVGLALGGGGARGVAHIGVLKVFDEQSIPVDLLVGTSIGALVGGAYASGFSACALEKRLFEFLDSTDFKESALNSIREIHETSRMGLTQKIEAFFKNRYLLVQAMFRVGMLPTEDFQAMINFFLPDIQVQDTQIPFRAVATDLVSGEPVVISEGPLRSAVMASCAVPGAVAPLALDGMLLSDGGVTRPVPTNVARQEGARFIVAVSVPSTIYSHEKFSSSLDVYVRASSITGYHFEASLLREADVIIQPRVGQLHWTDFALAKSLITEGENAARDRLKMLRKAYPLPRRWFSIFSP